MVNHQQSACSLLKSVGTNNRGGETAGVDSFVRYSRAESVIFAYQQQSRYADRVREDSTSMATEVVSPPWVLFITWTTYGSWLPGDPRGWRHVQLGQRDPAPLLEDWCRNRMKQKPVILDSEQRQAVEQVCREHAKFRNWDLHAIAVRSNHVHLAVTAHGIPSKVRDQFKANATRIVRQLSKSQCREKVWTKGGDIEILDNEEELYRVVVYIMEAQDRMDREV